MQEWRWQPFKGLRFLHDFIFEADDRPNQSSVYLRQSRAINSYFGSKISFYFTFNAYYISWLIPLILTGLLFSLPQLWYSNEAGEVRLGNGITLLNAIVVIAWGSFMQQRWLRKSHELAAIFGTRNFEQTLEASQRFLLKNEELERYQHPITGKMEPKFRFRERLPRYAWSFFVVAVCVTVVIVTCFLNLKLRYAVDPQGKNLLASIALGVENAVTVTILDALYTGVSNELVSYENHRTDFEQEQSKVGKLFVFRYINGFSGVLGPFFIPAPDRAAAPNSIGAVEVLGIQLVTLMLTQFAIVVAKEKLLIVMFLHWDSGRLKNKLTGGWFSKDAAAMTSQSAVEMTKRHQNILLDSIKPALDDAAVFDDYSYLAVQFAYVVSFAAVMPLAPLIALIVTSMELQLDLWKYVHLAQRPMPLKASGIGVWNQVLRASLLLAVPINCIVMFKGQWDTGLTELIADLYEKPGCERSLTFCGMLLVLLVTKEVFGALQSPFAWWVFVEDITTDRDSSAQAAAERRRAARKQREKEMGESSDDTSSDDDDNVQKGDDDNVQKAKSLDTITIVQSPLLPVESPRLSRAKSL
eukprot:Hpha_TRINITY_DN15812_c0_g11::TRINITY_DN15812_c0_g11_i1::g.188730::m.188730